MALSWKYLQDVQEEDVGINEVESEAWKREATREAKKGKERPKKKGEYSGRFRRNKGYIKKQMEIRVWQAKEDWEESRSAYRSKKRELLKNAGTEAEVNIIKRECLKIQRRNERVFAQERTEHKERIQHLKDRVKKMQKNNIEVQRREDLQNLRRSWLASMVSEQEETPPPTQVPTYGCPSLDEDELACLALPVNFTSYQALDPKDLRFEAIGTHTNSRWSRIGTGSPLEQEEDAQADQAAGVVQEQTEDEILLAEDHRVIYSMSSKTLDFRKLRTTDLKDCPRLYLPPPRPQAEEAEMGAKEFSWEHRYKIFMRNSCDESGRMKIDNMTRAERKGFFKLIKRAKSRELAISQTDKSAKNTVSTMESYIQQGSVHVQGDTKVEWKDYEKGKRLALAHTRCMSKIFQIGQDHGEKEVSRIKNAFHRGAKERGSTESSEVLAGFNGE